MCLKQCYNLDNGFFNLSLEKFSIDASSVEPLGVCMCLGFRV